MFPRPERRFAFTLLEVCIAIAIAMMLLGLAVPSLTGQAARMRLQKTFDRVDALAVEAQQRSVTEGKPYVVVWEDRGAIRLYPAEWSAKKRRQAGPVMEVLPGPNGETCQLERNTALAAGDAPAEWTFWPSGNCEPATLRLSGKGGEWEAAYNPLSARATLNRFIAH